MTMRSAWVGFGISAALFVGALFLPALYLADGVDGFYPGWLCFLLGWVALGAWVPGWIANPAWALGWLLQAVGSTLGARICWAIAVACALTPLGLREIWRDEAGNMSAVTGLGPGYVLWLAAITLPLVLSLLRRSHRGQP